MMLQVQLTTMFLVVKQSIFLIAYISTIITPKLFIQKENNSNEGLKEIASCMNTKLILSVASRSHENSHGSYKHQKHGKEQYVGPF
jgi:hypothetical protein